MISALTSQLDSMNDEEDVTEETESSTTEGGSDALYSAMSTAIQEGTFFDDIPPAHLAKMMSAACSKDSNTSSTDTREVNVSRVVYNVSNHNRRSKTKGLVDRGANGFVTGCDTRIIERNVGNPMVHIEGIDNHRMNDIPITTSGGVIQTHKGPAIGIVRNAAHTGTGRSILSCIQMEAFGIDVGDRAISLGGTQRIKTPEGYVIPISFERGLAYINIRPFTDKEFETLPHVFLTGAEHWDA